MADPRRKQTPHQSRISVQDVRDSSTPEGTALINEEFRRLALAFNNLTDDLHATAVQAGVPGAIVVTGPIDPNVLDSGGGVKPKSVYDLAILHDGVRVGPDTTTRLDFLDSETVRVEVTNVSEGRRSVSFHVELPTGGGGDPIATPLTVERNNAVVGDEDVVEILDFNETDYTRWSILDLGVRRRISHQYRLQVQDDGVDVGQDNARVLNFEDTATVVTSVSDDTNGVRTMTFTRPLTVSLDDLAVGNDETVWLNFENAALPTTDVQVSFEVEEAPGTGVRTIRAYVPALVGTSALQILDEGVNVGANDTQFLNFDATADVIPTVVDDGGGARTVTFELGPDIPRYWDLQIQQDGLDVGGIDTHVLEFVSTATASVTVTDTGLGHRTVSIDLITGAGLYDSWLLADADESVNISDLETATFLGSKGVVTELDTGTQTMTISRPLSLYEGGLLVGDDAVVGIDYHPLVTTETVPVAWSVTDNGDGSRRVEAFISTLVTTPDLTIEEQNVAVGGSDTTVLNFDSDGFETTMRPVWFDVTDDGSGQRTVKGYIEDPAAPEPWRLGANNESPGVYVEPGELVVFNQVGAGLTVSRSGFDINIENTWKFRIVYDVSQDVDYDEQIRFYAGTDIAIVQDGLDFTWSNTYSYEWELRVNSEVTGETISNGEFADFRAGPGISISRAGPVVTISNTDTYAYAWGIQENSETEIAVVNTGLVRFVDTGSLTWDVVQTASDVIRIRANVVFPADVPNLTIEEDGVAVGGSDTVFLNFDNTGAATTDVPVWFDVTDSGTGRRQVRAYVPVLTPVPPTLQIQQDGLDVGLNDTDTLNFVGTGVDVTVTDDAPGKRTVTIDLEPWNLADSDETVTIAQGQTATFTGTKRVVVELDTATRTIDISRPLWVSEDGAQVGDDSVLGIDFDNPTVEATDVQITFRVTDVGAGVRMVKGYVAAGSLTPSLQIREDGVNVGAADTDTLNFDKPVSPTSDIQGTFEVTDDGSGNRTVQVYVPKYSWQLGVNDETPGTEIDDGELVNFKGTGAAVVTRSSNTVTIHVDSETGPGSVPRRTMTGFIEFDNTGAPEAPYLFGIKKTFDIVHNWGLTNMHKWTLAVDNRDLYYSEADGTTPTYYRSGVGAMNGEADKGPQPFRNRTFYEAVDGNTIRVWMRQTRLQPTPAKMFYTLTEA